MGRENVEIFKRGVDAWNRDDFDAWIDLFDPELEWSALMEVFRGLDGARQAWATFKENMHLTVEFDDFRDLGEHVLALGEIKGVGHTTGLEVGSEVAQLATYRDGKAVSIRDFGSHTEGLKAAGLSE